MVISIPEKRPVQAFNSDKINLYSHNNTKLTKQIFGALYLYRLIIEFN
jgi:hypothetical protein